MVFRHRLRCVQFAEAEFSGQRAIQTKTCSRRGIYTYLYTWIFLDGMTYYKSDRLDKIRKVPHFSRIKHTMQVSDFIYWIKHLQCKLAERKFDINALKIKIIFVKKNELLCVSVIKNQSVNFFSFSPCILSQFTYIHQHMHTF